MAERKIIELLPEHLQNDQLRKFFNATVDHWFQKEQSKKVTGFVGRVPPYFDSTTDFYHVEPTSERQYYQLEPAMYTKNSEGGVSSTITYDDLINHLRYQGANVENHSRLFEQEYYSWAPPIDIDKFLNYSNYYWYPTGPTSIIVSGNPTVTIDVDTDIIGKATYTSPNNIVLTNGMWITFGSNVSPGTYLSKTWIVEGVGTGIVLIDRDDLDSSILPLEYDETDKDYILLGRGALNKNPWSRNNHWYHKDVLTFSTTAGDLFIAEETAVLWDVDPWDSTPWDSVVTELVSSINLNQEQQAKRPIIEFDKDLELYNYGTINLRNVDLVDTEHTDVFSEIQGVSTTLNVTVDGVILTDGTIILVTEDTNLAVNDRIYEINFLEVSPGNFEYQLILKTDGVNGDGSPSFGEQSLILSGTKSGQEYYYNGNSYVLTQRKTDKQQAPLFKLYDSDGNYIADESNYNDSSFFGNKIFSYKIDTSNDAIVDAELDFGIFYKNFSQVSEILFEHNLETSTYTYEIEPLVRAEIPGYYYYHRLASTGITENYGNSWNKATNVSTQNLEGEFYSIPLNLQANPNFEEVEEVSRSEILSHFGSIISNQIGISGRIFSDTNYIDLSKDRSLGVSILQHQAPLLKTMLLASSSNLDYMQSVSYSQREYRRLYNKIVNKTKLFIDNGMDDTLSASVWLEDAISQINVSKIGGEFPFIRNRTLPISENYITATYTAVLNETTFELPNIFDETSTSSTDMILIYVDGVLQLIDYDYTIVSTDAVFNTGMSGGETVEIRYYDNLDRSFIPSTAAMLGLTNVYKPVQFIDNTYINERTVIQGHDGSIIHAYGDKRDEVILEFEKRIYNTIRNKFRGDKTLFFDINEIRPGKFRDVGYTQEEFKSVLTPIFTTWATLSGLNWSDNNTNDNVQWKTWNWSGLLDTIDSEPLFGSWRAIYNYYYDTDRPHSHPWEMLGFSEEPSWWVAEYGSAPYTSTNAAMWADLEAGTIKQGPRAGTHTLYARTGLSNYIPVNDGGDLLDPVTIGIFNQNPNIDERSADWEVGDWSPVETAFFRSPETSFIWSKLAYLLKPAKWIELGWDTEEINFSVAATDQLVNDRFLKRSKHENLYVAGEYDADNNLVRRQGVQQWITNFLEYHNKDVKENFGDAIRNINVSLGWKAAGFLETTTLKFLADSYTPGSTSSSQKVFIQNEDLNIDLYESSSIKESFYSGILIEWNGTGYAVFGYDVLYPFFKTIPANTGSRKTNITVADITVTEYKDRAFDVVQEYPYGYEFTSRQDLYDFMIGYGAWLESQGWVFDEFDNSINEIYNWRYSGKEFLFWSQDDLEIGSFISLSPAANQIKFVQQTGLIQNVEEIIQGAYSVLDRAGQPIQPSDIETVREDSELLVRPLNTQGLYGLRLSVKTYEHLVLFENITRFNDTVYLPLFNLRQQRLKAVGTITDNWNGRVDTPGFILDLQTSNNLIPNFEKTVDNFRRYNSIENPSENDVITDVARHTIGYQRREYLDNLLVDRDTQYQFYQGFLHQKGSHNSLNRLLRSTSITTSDSVNFFEEWAFRIGEYGGVNTAPSWEFFLRSTDVKTNPQLIKFGLKNQADSPYDNIIDILPNDNRWIVKPELSEETFSLRAKNTYFKKDLPNAGYVKFGDTDYLAETVEKLFNNTKSVFNATVDETVWVARDVNYTLQKSWDVLILKEKLGFVWHSSSLDNNILQSYRRDTFTGNAITDTFTVTSNINLDENYIFVYINGELNNDYVVSGTDQIVFNTAPAISASIVIDSLTTHDWTNVNSILVFENADGAREAGVADVLGSSTISIKEEYIFSEIFEGASLYYWESRRFNGGVNPDILLAPADYSGELVYFDQSELNDGWAVYRSNGTRFVNLRSEQQLIDIENINDALIYDDKLNRITGKATVYDPFKGYIPGVADVEITYKLEYDPAKYTNSGTSTIYDTDLAWSDGQTGRTWWDLKTVRYVWYEQADLEYRYQNWGKLFPGTSVDIYEWVRSPVAPSDWADYVEENASEFNFSLGGVVKDIDSDDGPQWVERTEKNEQGSVQTFYYFWVSNKETVPNLPFRSLSTVEIANIIKNPLTYGIKWASPLRDDAFIIANVETDLNEQDTALQINFATNSNVPTHRQWVLLRENDEFSHVPDRLWNKMKDSLVGFDDSDKEVPDRKLRGRVKYGNLIRPRQSWFEDKLKAREIFVKSINTTLKNIDVVGAIPNYDTHLNTEDNLIVTSNIVNGTVANPIVTTGGQLNINGTIITFSGVNGIQQIIKEINIALDSTNVRAEIFYSAADAFVRIYDSVLGQDINILDVSGTPAAELGFINGNYTGTGPRFVVSSRANRDALTTMNVGDKVYVTSDEEVRNYWTYWEYSGSNEWKLLQVQDFKTNIYWSFIDWYLDGYDSDTIIDRTFDTLFARNASLPIDGEIVKVANDGSGKWSLYLYENEAYTTIGKEDSTIEFSDLLHDSEKAGYGFDDAIFDVLPFDSIPNREFKEIITGLKENILVGSLNKYQNTMFFKMVRYAHTEHELLDWVFKTSYIFIIGFTEELSQKPLFINDGFETLVEYVKEAKPYHTKIKDIVRTFANVTDPTTVSVIDYDKPVYNDPVLGSRILDETNTADANFMEGDDLYSAWFTEYTKDLRPGVPRVNNVRKLTSRIALDRVAAIKSDFVSSTDYTQDKSQLFAIDSASTKDATLFNTPYVKGLLGNAALEFNGTTSYALIGSATDYQFGTGDFTIELTIVPKRVNHTNTQQLIEKRTNGSGNVEIQIETSNKVKVYIEQTASSSTLESTTELQINKQYHIALVRVLGVANLYIDGVLEASVAATQNINSSGILTLGRDSELVPPAEYFQGTIDEVRLWTSERTLSDINTYKDVELTGTELNLTGYWKFNEGIVHPYPFFDNTNFEIADAYDNPSWILLDNYTGVTAPTNNLAIFRYKPINSEINVSAIGTWTNNSSIVIEAGDKNDFTGTNITLLTITSNVEATIDFNDIWKKYPYIRANISGYVSGDTINVTISALYENALTRLIVNYAPTNTQPSLLDVITSSYLGTFVDGSNVTLEEGWDVTPWDYAGWDADASNLATFIDKTISGGAFFTYEGDGTVGVFSLPQESIAVPPWSVYISDTTLPTLTPYLMNEGVHYNIVGDMIILLSSTSFPWETGGNLLTGWALTIVDSTYSSDDIFAIIIEGNSFVQPYIEGWPEELVPLKLNESTLITVVTSGTVEFNLLENATSAITGDVVTFADQIPLLFTTTGISGDTIILEGSNTGAFAGEETVIETLTTNTTIKVPDIIAGYAAFTYYRARVSVYGTGNITLYGAVAFAPVMNQEQYIYTSGTTFDIGQNVEETDDVLISINGIMSTSYTVDTTLNQYTFTISPTAGDIVNVTSWDSSNSTADPTFFTDTYLGSALDLTNFGGALQDVKPAPSEPLECGILVFADDNGDGNYRRLLPPEARHHMGDGSRTTFEVLRNQYNIRSNVTAFISNVSQNDGTDYAYLTNGLSTPTITPNNIGSGYTIGDIVEISGGTLSRNLLLYTEEFDNVYWVWTDIVSVTSNAALDPYGELTADVVNGDTFVGSNIGHSYIPGGVIPQEPFTLSLWVRVKSGTPRLTIFERGGVSADVGWAGSSMPVSSEIIRYSMTITPAQNDRTELEIQIREYTAGGLDVDIWGFQLEQNPIATDYVSAIKIKVLEVAPINAQDETSYDNTPATEGTFVGGTGHAALDVITLNDGTTITVDAVSGGVVTQFTVNSIASVGLTTNGSTLTQTTTTGVGVGFTLTLDSANEGVKTLKPTNPGMYTVAPTTPNTPRVPVPVTVTGSGLTVDLASYSTIADKVQFITAPSDGSHVALRILGNHEYSISGNNIDFTTLTSGDVVGITGFETDNSPMGMHSVSITGDTSAWIDGNTYKIPIGNRPVSSEYILAYYRFIGSNLLTYSEQFDNVIWVKSNVTVTANTSGAPDGTITADSMIENTSNAEHYMDQTYAATTGLSYTWSVYIKPSSGSRVLRLRTHTAVSAFADFNPDTGLLGTLSNCTANVTVDEDGFFRVSMTVTAASTTTLGCRIQMYPTAGSTVYTGDGSSSIIVWGAQLEQESRIGQYIATTTTAIAKPDHTEQTTESITITNTGGWDSGGWDSDIDSFEGEQGAVININSNGINTDQLIVTTFSGSPAFSTVTYREFIGYEVAVDDIYEEYIRFADTYKTTLSSMLQVYDNIINVSDASIFPLSNGIAWVNGERIPYLTRTGGATPGAAGTLTGLVRGGRGTRKNKTHANGSTVRPGDATQTLDAKNLMFNDPGLRLQVSTNRNAVFLNANPGGYKSFT